MKALLCELLFTCILAAPGARSPDELAYGNMLYAYFQDEHEAALLEVMEAEARGQLGADPARFALAKGSLAFEEGLYRMSDAAFAGLEPGRLGDVDRMRLAFHRARAYYRDGAWDAMSAELDRIRFDPTWFGRERHHPEVEFMRAEAGIAAGDFARAEQALATLAPDEDYLAYGLFNLAVARRAAGDLAGAQDALVRLADLPLTTDVGRDLVARGRLALAMTAGTAADNPAARSTAGFDAQAVLDRLPASSRYREQALAVYGDLAMRRGDYRLAARIWLTLEQGDDWHFGRDAAGLGLPMALEGLADPGAALEGYRRAADAYAARLAGLETLAAQTRDPAWTGRLLRASLPQDPAAGGQHPQSGVSAQRGPPDLPGVAEAFGRGAWREWLADDEVNRLLGEWRKLDRMRSWLDALPAQLGALEQVKQERARRTSAARQALTEQNLIGRRDALLADIDRLNDRVGTLNDPDRSLDDELVAALANAAERKQLERLDRLAAALAAAPGSTRQTELAARIARLRGIVVWKVAESRSTRVRGLVKELEKDRALLAEVDARVARLSRAEAELAAGAAADFAALTVRAGNLTAAVDAGLAAREAALAAAFRGALDRERTRTGDYLLRARIAVARTTDQLAATTHPQRPES